MVEPLAILAGLGAVSDVGELIGMAKAWLDGNELDRLLDQLDRVFGEETGLSAAQLETWKDDEGFCAVLFAISYTADWDDRRTSLREEVIRLIAEDVNDPRLDELELADAVVEEIKSFLPYAKQGDEVTRYVGRQTVLATERTTLRIWTSDWAPEQAQNLLDQLAAESATEATHLQDALRDRDAKTEITGLLRSPPKWVKEGSGLLWEVLAASAEGVGLWPEALEAWDEAFERPGSDRARTRVRATTAAHIAGDPEGGQVRFAEADELDPTHPLVLFAKAQQSTDPQSTLKLLDSIEPRTTSQAAIRDARRAVPLAELGRWNEADEALSGAREAGVPEIELRELEATITLLRDKAAWLRGSQTDTTKLNEAATLYLELRDKHRAVNAHEGSIAYLSKAVDALTVADERLRAAELMDVGALRDEELSMPTTRLVVGEHLLRIGRPDLAAAMLTQADADDSEPAQLLQVIARIEIADDGEELNEMIEFLDRAVAEGEHRLPAAHARMIATLRRGAEWNEPAFKVLAAQEAGLANLFRAQWLARKERWDEAERTLQPHTDEPRAQHALLEIALKRDEPERIAVRAREILSRDSDFAVRLEAARALIRIEKHAEAETELGALIGSSEAPRYVRLAAFPELAELLQQDERYRELLELTDIWLELDPSSPNVLWGRAHALFRLGRFKESLALVDEHGIEPHTLPQAQLLGRLCGLVLKGEEAVRRIIKVADRLDEPDETLEALALFSTLDTAGELPRELLERVNPTRFTTRFPRSTFVRSIKAPETLEDFASLLQEVEGDRKQRIARATTAVFDQAESPVALIALAAGKSVAETWRGLNRRPTSFGIAELVEDERANAANALTVGAVWDPSSLYFAEVLGAPLGEKLRAALPKSVVSQNVLDDALVDSNGPQASELERLTVGLDEAGQPFGTTWSAEEVREEREIADRTRELTRSLEIEPDAPAEDGGIEARSIRDNEVAPQILTFAGTLAVARRLELPVFSADRFVRLQAKRAGLRAFGIESMIDALADRGDLSAEEREGLRRRLRELGAMGTRPTAAELVADARLAEFRLTVAVGLSLQDVTPLRADAREWHATLLDFLRTVQREAPTTLDVWTTRVIDALHQNLAELSPWQHASRLLVLAWKPTSEEDPFIEPFATSLEKATKYLGDHDNPILAAGRFLDEIMRPEFDLATRIRFIGQFADQMTPSNSLRLRFMPLYRGEASAL